MRTLPQNGHYQKVGFLKAITSYYVDIAPIRIASVDLLRVPKFGLHEMVDNFSSFPCNIGTANYILSSGSWGHYDCGRYTQWRILPRGTDLFRFQLTYSRMKHRISF